MTDIIPPPQVFVDAGVDSKTIEDTVNGAPDTQVTSRLGRKFWTLATINSRLNLVVLQADEAIRRMNEQVNTVSDAATDAKGDINTIKQDVNNKASAAKNDIDAIKSSTQAALDDAVQDFEQQGEVVLIDFRDAVQTIVVDGGVPAQAVVVGDSTLDIFAEKTQYTNDIVVDVRKFGAIGDGVLHKVQEWTQVGSRIYYPNLAAIQVDYPHVTSLDDSTDWAATQKAVNTPNLYKIKFPCVVANGIYNLGSNELVIPNDKSNLTFIGDGSADTGATVIRSTPNKIGFIAIHSKAYATTLIDLALLSTTGNDDGFAAIGFLHMRDTTGSTGRLCHTNLRIQGFSKHACKVGQAINYQFDNITFSGGIETLWIGRDAAVNQRSTTVSLYHAYITGGKRCGVYLDRPSDFLADRLIIESSGKGVNPETNDFYEDAAGLINQGTGQCQLNAAYFEDNRRNIWSDSPIVTIAPNYGPAILPDVWQYQSGAADNQKGRTEILRNSIRTRYLRADEFKGYLEVPDEIRFNAKAKYNADVVATALCIGSQADYGRVDGLKHLTLNSNMSGAENVNIVGQELRFGVTNSSVGVTSRWLILGHRRLDNTNTALGVYVNTGTTSFTPDGTAVKLGEWNSKLGLVLAPKSNAIPEINGEMTFEKTSDTELKIKVKGSDGVVRFATLQLTN